ncbi:MAG TPA: SGNH/GDSL hydrolase family protein [Vicinamibacterales bacterium]|nr:SGNH/GDSL hydrolase family protein [Vicinamibacterales bacterium]
MTVRETRSRTWAVWLAVSAAIVLLWILTAGEDAEWALWRHYTAATALRNVAGSAALLALGYLLSSGRSLAGRLARVVAISLAAGGTLAVLELPAIVLGHDYGQTFATRANDTWRQLSSGLNRRDDELIHVHQPHSRFRGSIGGNLGRLGLPSPARYDVDVAYDKNGFRNDVDFTQADVVAIGDSFVEAAEIAKSQTVVAELGRRLGVTVANLGQSGYGPQQELIVLKRYGAPLSPKVVVWFLFGGNDLSDVDEYEWRRDHLDEFLAPPPLGARTFMRNSLTALARLTMPTRRTLSDGSRRHEVTFTRADGSREVIYLDAPESEWQAHQWDVTSSTLLNARDLSNRGGAEFLLVYIPRKLRVYQGYLSAAPDSYAHSWQLNNLPEVLGDFCRKHGILFLDSTVPLREAVASGESVYLPDDVHWNAAGHRVVAAAVADRIHQMGKLSTTNLGALR